MSDSIFISGETRKEKYQALLPQLKALTEGEADLIANLGNIIAALKQTFDFFWLGFYFVRDKELVLGPFQGPVACTRIAFGKGVCGSAWKERRTLIVPDVDQFPGHIACSSESRSEIVVPVFNEKNEVRMVLDIDSDKLNDFDEVDENYLQEVVDLVSQFTS